MAKYIEAGATLRFFEVFVALPKFSLDHQNQQDEAYDGDVNVNVELDMPTQIMPETAHQFIGDPIQSTSTHVIDKENQDTSGITNIQRAAKKPFQMMGRHPSSGLYRLKPLNLTDSRRFKF